MSQEDLQKFLEAVRQDSSLQQELSKAGDAEAVVAMAQAAGYSISAKEFEQAQAALSDEELEGIAGGSRAHHYATGNHCRHHTSGEFCIDPNQSDPSLDKVMEDWRRAHNITD